MNECAKLLSVLNLTCLVKTYKNFLHDIINNLKKTKGWDFD